MRTVSQQVTALAILPLALGSAHGGPPVSTTLSVSDVDINEGDVGDKIVEFTVTRSDNTSDVSVDVATADGSAVAGTDYAALGPTTLNFTAGGEFSRNVSVSVFSDLTTELDEQFTVELSNANGATPIGGPGAGVIRNDDQTRVSITDLIGSEGTSADGNGVTQFAFKVSADRPTDAAYSVAWSLSDGTATAASSDYTDAVGTLDFSGSPGEILTIDVDVRADRDDRDDRESPTESFSVELDNIVSNGRDVVLADASATGTIQDDDIDTDRDYAPDALELQLGISPTNKDSDDDGIEDGVEIAFGLNPNAAVEESTDSDGDEIPDIVDPDLNNPDLDGNGITDFAQHVMNGNLVDPTFLGDADGTGSLDFDDVTYLLRQVRGLNPPVTRLRDVDIDRSGGPPTMRDVIELLYHLRGRNPRTLPSR